MVHSGYHPLKVRPGQDSVWIVHSGYHPKGSSCQDSVWMVHSGLKDRPSG